MQLRPFSLNFDESTVNGRSILDINCSYVNEENLVEKRMWQAISLEAGTTGLELADTICAALLEDKLDPQMVMSISTDGCAAMLGVLKGAVTILRERIKTLPKWGGCKDHDLANLLKAAVKELSPHLTSIFSGFFGCLSKHSMHKKRMFEELEEMVGIDVRKVPKFIDVRFRVIFKCCEWLETQDRALYLYFKSMKEKIMKGKYLASETEMVVVTKFLGNYLEIRLTSLFILEVAKPVMELISFFESTKIRIQDQHAKLVLLLYDYLGKFVKNAGVDGNNNITGEGLLKVKYKDKTKQLPNKDIFLGSKVQAFLLKLGINRDSPEIQFWLSRVRKYYEAALDKMVKYFAGSITSGTLRALSVLSPTAWGDTELDQLKSQWRKLAQAFPNVLKVSEIPDLMSEVTLLKGKGLKAVTSKTRVDEFFKELGEEKYDEDRKCYPLLMKLGQALATIYNSSSSAERDFSLMNAFLSDPHKSSMSHRLLLSKMHVKAECLSLARHCSKCQTLAQKDERSNHCHCEKWSPPEELLASLRNGGAYKRYEADRIERAEEAQDKKVIKELLLDEDKLEEETNLKQELEFMKKRESDRKFKDDEEKKAREKEKKEEEKRLKKASANGVKKAGAPGVKKAGAPGVKKVSEAEKKRSEQRRKLME